jgi:hypothetical protein
MAYTAPAKLLRVTLSGVSVNATYSGGDPHNGAATRWNATLTVVAQPHSDPNSTPAPNFYRGENVAVGDCIASTSGRILRIQSIASQNASTVVCVLEDLNRENCLIDLIINEKIDDVISQLGDSDMIKVVDDLSNKINLYIVEYKDSVENLIKKYNGDIVSFSKENSKDKLFPIAIQVIRGKDIISLIKEFILRNTSRLQLARDFIKKLNMKYDKEE